MAGLVTIPLNDEETTTTTYGTYSLPKSIPLTEQQTNDFIRTFQYSQYVEQRLECMAYYIDRNGQIQRKFSKDGITRMSDQEIDNLKAEQRFEMIKADKHTLMNRGIKALPKAHDLPRAITLCYDFQDSPIPRKIAMILCCCLPHLCPECCNDPDKELHPLHLGKELNFFA